MKFITRLFVLTYVALVLYICSFLLFLFLIRLIPFDQVYLFVRLLYFDNKTRLILAGFTFTLFIFNYFIYRIFASGDNRYKTVAFDNPSGRVIVSLRAIEDLILKQVMQMAEVKDVKLNIVKARKKVLAKIKLSLRSEVNIPEITEIVQEIVKGKLQDLIGLDEPITFITHIGKITSEEIRQRTVVPQQEEKKTPTIPFQGYRA